MNRIWTSIKIKATVHQVQVRVACNRMAQTNQVHVRVPAPKPCPPLCPPLCPPGVLQHGAGQVLPGVCRLCGGVLRTVLAALRALLRGEGLGSRVYSLGGVRGGDPQPCVPCYDVGRGLGLAWPHNVGG